MRISSVGSNVLLVLGGLAFFFSVVSMDPVPSPKVRLLVARVQIDNFMTALRSYRADTGHFPSAEAGLQALRSSDVKGWNGPYLQKDIPLDPWNSPYIYIASRSGEEPKVVCSKLDRRNQLDP